MNFPTATQTTVPEFDLHPLFKADAADVARLLGRAESRLGWLPDEMDIWWIEDVLEAALVDSFAVGAYDESGLVGVLLATRMSSKQFNHVLSDLTVAIDAESKGVGVERSLLVSMLLNAPSMDPRIERVELVVGESQTEAIGLYESLGFRREGRLGGRFRLSTGGFEDGLLMALLLQH